MATAEQLALLIGEDGRGAHVLLWDDKQDLVHALLILLAVLGAEQVYFHVVSTDRDGAKALRDLVDMRCPLEGDEEVGDARSPLGLRLWVLFLPQASSQQAGPWLNGWRRPLSEPPGTLLVVRHADFDAFQRSAPDLASFVGPRVYDASTMLSIISGDTARRLQARVPPDLERCLKQLPGKPPTREQIEHWLAAQAAGGPV